MRSLFLCFIGFSMFASFVNAQETPVDSLSKEEVESKYNVPYKNTYINQALVTENEFRTADVSKISPKSFSEAKKILPKPIWKGHSKEIEMYWKAWEIAIDNIRQPLDGSGFVSPYLDTAYNGNIFMWDDAFMMMFTRYGYRFFPFQKTLDNFYSEQHPDGFICREIGRDGADAFERYDPVSTGPNLLPWAEMMYYKQFGDKDRLKKVFPALVAYYKWLKLNRTWRDGTYWSSGWGTGMDNLPRVESKYNEIFSNGHMVWLDTNLQQIFMANILLEMGFDLERWQEIEDFEDDIKFLSKYVRDSLWDDESKFLYDQFSDGSLSDTKGIMAFWALHTDVLSDDQLDKLVDELDSPKTFKRPHRVPSLSANNAKYHSEGRYWQGGVWPGTNYMVITGLTEKGYREKAKEIAFNDYKNIFEVYKDTGTFWEYYAPEKAKPGFMAREDFVGWTGLPPIAEFIEYILGIRSDYSQNSVVWDVTQTDKHGIERYPFGPDGVISFLVDKRSSKQEEPQITIDSNTSFELKVYWGDNKSKKIKVKRGKHTY